MAPRAGRWFVGKVCPCWDNLEPCWHLHQSASRGCFQESPGRAPEPLEGGVSTLTDWVPERLWLVIVCFVINYILWVNLIGYCEFITLFLDGMKWYTENVDIRIFRCTQSLDECVEITHWYSIYLDEGVVLRFAGTTPMGWSATARAGDISLMLIQIRQSLDVLQGKQSVIDLVVSGSREFFWWLDPVKFMNEGM